MLCSNLLGVKANLCLHNSQYSFLLYFNHCTKLENEKQQMSLNPFFYIDIKVMVSTIYVVTH